MAVKSAAFRLALSQEIAVWLAWLVCHGGPDRLTCAILRGYLARPPASHSGIGGYTGRAQALSLHPVEPGGAPVVPFARPSPVSLQSVIPGGPGGLAPRFSLKSIAKVRTAPRELS